MKSIFKLGSAVIALTFVLGAAEALAAKTQWNASLWGKRRAFTEHMEKLSESVAERTNGDFTITLNYGQTLSKNRENLDGIAIGAFEMAQICAGYHRDKNPTLTVLELPFLGVETLEEELAVSRAVYAHPATMRDLARWNAMLLMPSPMPQYNIAGTTRNPDALDDFDGMRIRATGGIGQAFINIGAVPTSMTASEVYNALDSGVVDAIAFPPHAHISFRTIDLVSWWTSNLNPGTVNCPVVVNIDAYDALPEAHRAALLDSIPEALTHYLDSYAQVYERWWPLLEDENIHQITFSDADIAAFRDASAAPVREAWIAYMKKRGLPAEDLYELVVETLNKHRSSQ